MFVEVYYTDSSKFTTNIFAKKEKKEKIIIITTNILPLVNHTFKVNP